MSKIHLKNPLNMYTFLELMLVKLSNVSFARIMCICGNPEGDEGYGQLVVCFTCSKKCLYLTSILYITHLFPASLFKCFFVCLLKFLNDRNENEFKQAFLHMQFSITFLWALKYS